jgi:hypothetical protein
MTILSTQNQCMVSAAAAYTTSGCRLPTQGCCKRVLFTCLFTQMAQEKKKAYALEGNLEQIINCIRDAQTLNWGQILFHFLNVTKTLNRGKLYIT